MGQNESDGRKIIARGIIRGHEAGGKVVLESGPEGTVVRLEDYWIAAGAPDVRVYLSPDKAGNVEIEGVVDFGRVNSFSGQLSYNIPEAIPVQEIGSLVVYCKVYSVTFGVAVLEFL